jgi:hypothetical protein
MTELDGPLVRLEGALERGRPAVLIGTAGVLLADLVAHTVGTHQPFGLSVLNRLLAAYCVVHLGVDLLRHGPESFVGSRAADTAVYLPHAALAAGVALLPGATHLSWITWAEPTCQAACVVRELAALDLLIGSELLRRWSPSGLPGAPLSSLWPSWLPSLPGPSSWRR